MSDDQISPTALTSLDPRQKNVLRVRALVFGLVPLAMLCIADVVLNAQLKWSYGYLTGLGVALYAALVLVLPGRRYRRWGYHMGADAIRIASGMLVRRETIVPFGRVQHIDVSRGPIERTFSVATLTLHTAGSYNSTVALPGLEFETANAIREEIRAHIRQDLP